MDKNDYLGSFAQENVSFQTQVVKTASVGDNYWKVMVFVENERFISDQTVFAPVDGSETIKAATVTADTYASATTGLLQSWLTDLFVNGFTGDAYIVQVAEDVTGEDMTAFIEAMDAAFALLTPYAYWKVALAGADTAAQASVNAHLADLCKAEKSLLSGPVPVPFSTATPDNPESDEYYKVCKDKYVFMSAHQDATRNAALYSLGLALSIINGSGTSIGNNFDMVKSTSITSSGKDGTPLAKGIRTQLNSLNIQTFKPVGNNTGAVAAEGDLTLTGDTVGAQWIVCYVGYMVKVRVAEMLTTVNFYKKESSYTEILQTLQGYLALFGPAGSGRLENLSLTAPGYDNLPDAAGDELVIPDAWKATYVNHLRRVTITGTLYIGA